MQITLTIPEYLEQQLIDKAGKLNLPIETLILQSLGQLFEEDKEDLSKEDILNSLLIALQEVKDGKVHPIAELWDGIDV
ncbi:hypothetical protein [Microcoleus sp. bin38.metabat.b11b12b14.051]|uniref:hypothetical protein n=1 Tax=Microcoleus sp. bin38.metabat.b11b12b14.051 TaxID=2742709 RepID=UPI0025E42F9A|nr:hypothetical protein [Microcoleus sp. bin38.metabat.b11b12b14.051]